MMASRGFGQHRDGSSRRRTIPALVVCGFVLAIAAMVATSIGVADSKTGSKGKTDVASAERDSELKGNGKGRGAGLERERETKRGVLVVKGNRGNDKTATSTTEPGSTSTVSERSTSTTEGSSSSTTSPSTTESVPTTKSSSPSTSAPTTSAPTTTSSTRPPSTVMSTTTTRPTTSTTKGSSGAGEWFEGFDSLNTSRWLAEHSTYGDGNGERQCYQPDNVSVEGGRLILRAAEETVTCPSGSTRTISSGMVRSRGLSFSPGQAIEFRVKLNVADSSNQAGLWPAVWSSSWAGGWPVGGELDYLEVMTAEDPNRAMFSMHYADDSGRHRLQNRPAYLDGRFSDDWHTIRFDYGYGGRLTWYLDGRQVFSVDSAATRQGYPAPFDQTIPEIKINLAVGGSPGALGSGVLSKDATFEVDYIRVFNL